LCLSSVLASHLASFMQSSFLGVSLASFHKLYDYRGGCELIPFTDFAP